MSDLDTLRAELLALDREILERVAARREKALEIGRAKAAIDRPTRDFQREKVVIDRARAQAEALGLPPDVAERLLLLLIESSLTVQEQDRVERGGSGDGRRVLVIGGAGKIGGWFARFLDAQGYSVEIADPTPGAAGFAQRSHWRDGPVDHDVIVVAAPLGITADVLLEIAEHKPPGVVFDVGSLKTPLRPGLQALIDAGVRATSVHPMFGPDTELLSGRHLIFVDLGVPEATAVARDLFASTMATQVEMTLDEHDELIAFVLGLSHALNIAFFTALAESGQTAPRLARASSTTFDAQLEVARRVAAENPHLYYEIQHLNAYGVRSLDALCEAAAHLRRLVVRGDEAGFVQLMDQGRQYLLTRDPP